jgi:mono/diheme cytochrome c family protein
LVAVGGPGSGARLLAFALATDTETAQTLTPQAIRAPLEVEQICGQCHSFESVTRTRRTRAQWNAQIEAMIAKGAHITDAEFDTVAQYLTSHFGPTSP